MEVLASEDVLRNPFAMVVLDNRQVNSEEEQDQDMHLVIQVERPPNMDADSLDSELAVLAYFYHLQHKSKCLVKVSGHKHLHMNQSSGQFTVSAI